MSSKRTFTVEEIERVLAAVAYIVVRHGEEYVPLLDRARRILASLTKEVKGAQAV